MLQALLDQGRADLVQEMASVGTFRTWYTAEVPGPSFTKLLETALNGPSPFQHWCNCCRLGNGTAPSVGHTPETDSETGPWDTLWDHALTGKIEGKMSRGKILTMTYLTEWTGVSELEITSRISTLDRLIRTARDHSNEANRMKHPSNLGTTKNRTRVPQGGSSARHQLRKAPGLEWIGEKGIKWETALLKKARDQNPWRYMIAHVTGYTVWHVLKKQLYCWEISDIYRYSPTKDSEDIGKNIVPFSLISHTIIILHYWKSSSSGKEGSCFQTFRRTS